MWLAALDVNEVQEVRQEDEEDGKDVDHPDPRLDEEHPVETDERRGGDRENPAGPEAPCEEVHHRDAQRSEQAGGAFPAAGGEHGVDVVAGGALEMSSEPAVSPLA